MSCTSTYLLQLSKSLLFCTRRRTQHQLYLYYNVYLVSVQEKNLVIESLLFKLCTVFCFYFFTTVISFRHLIMSLYRISSNSMSPFNCIRVTITTIIHCVHRNPNIVTAITYNEWINCGWCTFNCTSNYLCYLEIHHLKFTISLEHYQVINHLSEEIETDSVVIYFINLILSALPMPFRLNIIQVQRPTIQCHPLSWRSWCCNIISP